MHIHTLNSNEYEIQKEVVTVSEYNHKIFFPEMESSIAVTDINVKAHNSSIKGKDYQLHPKYKIHPYALYKRPT